MVAARSVTVKLKLDASDFNRGLAQAAASAKAFQKTLSDGGGGGSALSGLSDDANDFSAAMNANTESLNKNTESLGETNAALEKLRAGLRGGGNDGDKFSDHIGNGNSRLALMVQYGIALGPALVPALAAAAPLAAALGSSLAVATVAGGTAVLAFQGVGDALKAMNDYAVDPTEEHLQKLKETMDTLGPAGQEFVVFLQELRPEIQKLQNVAQEGMFPGLQEGIESLMTQAPLLTQVIDNFATAMGDMAAEGGEALTNPFWTDFFVYLRDDGTEILKNLTIGFGKLFEGITALVMDFAPLTNDWIASFADMGRSFSTWAQELPQTAGFQEFMDYLRKTGPEVLDTIGALSKAILDIAIALSGMPAEASLAILQTLATVLSGLASSPIGPSLLTLAVGLSALSRALALYNTAKGSALVAFLGGQAGKPGVAGALSKIPFSKFGAMAGGFTLLADSMTGFSDALGAENTITFAAIGAMFGPWGAAVGAAGGLVKDFAASNDQLNDTLERTSEIVQDNPLDLSARIGALKQLRAVDDDLSGKHGFVDYLKTGTDFLTGPGDLFQDYQDQAKSAEEAAQDLARENLALQQGILEFDQELSGRGLGAFDTSLQNVMDTAGTLIPNLQAVGYSSEKIQEILLTHKGWDEAQEAVRKYIAATDSVEGRSKAVGTAIADLGDASITTAQSADALSAALDSLFSPALDYSRAMDEWREGIRHLDEDLKGSSLDPNTDVGAANREVIRQQVEQMLTVLNAAAASGEVGPRQLVNQLEAMREQMIQVGKEAGLQGPKLRDFLATLNLTPKQIRIAVHAAGVEKARQDAKNLADDIKKIPKDVKTDIIANGLPADATVKSLMRKYDDLSRHDAETILKARDAATPTIDKVKQHADKVDDDFVARISVDTGSSMGKIIGVKLGLDSIDGRVATAYTEVRNRTINTVLDRHLTGGSADGNLFTFSNGGTWPSIGSQQPQIQPNRGPGGIMWAETGAGPWEAFISGHPNKRERSKDIATDVVDKLGGVAMFADGGQAGRQISASDLGRRSVRLDLSFMRDLEKALNRMRHEAREVERQEDRVTAARRRSREATHKLNEISKQLDAAESKDKVNRKEVYRLKQLEIAQRKRERDAIKKQTYEEKQLAKQEAELAKARDKWKQQQQQLLSQAQAISSVVREQGAIFGGQGTSVSVGGILAKLRTSARDAGKFRHYIAKLRGMGLDERLIQQLLEQGPTPEGLAAARNLAQASEHELRQINRQERQLVGVAASTGALGIARQSAGVIVNMNIKKVETTDVRALARELPRQTVRALRVARAKA